MNWVIKPDSILKIENCNTPIQALRANSATLHEINATAKELEGNNGCLVAMLTLLLEDFVLFFNVSETMGPAQIKQTIDLMIGDHVIMNLKPEDLRVYFNMFKRGAFGKVYNRIDGQVVLLHLQEYCLERMNMAEERGYSHHKEVIDGEKKDAEKIGPEQFKILKETIKTIADQEKAKQKPRPVREKSELDLKIEKYYDEFFEIWKTNPMGAEFGKHILYNDKLVTASEYVYAKIKEHSKNDNIGNS